jgi:hypothetical protein
MIAIVFVVISKKASNHHYLINHFFTFTILFYIFIHKNEENTKEYFV